MVSCFSPPDRTCARNNVRYWIDGLRYSIVARELRIEAVIGQLFSPELPALGPKADFVGQLIVTRISTVSVNANRIQSHLQKAKCVPRGSSLRSSRKKTLTDKSVQVST